MYTINLEMGYPDVNTALKQFEFALATAKARKYPMLKLIHGYGSSGTGGKIKTAVTKALTTKKKNGVIQSFFSGERFSPFEEETQKALLKYPDLAKDSDYFRCNHGITIVCFCLKGGN